MNIQKLKRGTNIMEDFLNIVHNLMQFTDEVLEVKLSSESYNYHARLLNDLEEAYVEQKWSTMLDIVKQLDDICETTIKMLLNDEYEWYGTQVNELFKAFWSTVDKEVKRISNLGIVEIEND